MGQYTTWRPGYRMTDARLNAAEPTISSYTPVWGASTSAPSLGNGTLLGQWAQVDGFIWFGIWMTTGSTSSYGNGSYNWTVPVASAGAQITPILGRLSMGSGGAYAVAGQVGLSDTAARFFTAHNATVSNSGPAAWTTGTSIVISGWYPAA